MAERRPFTACQYAGNPPALLTERAVPNRVDTSVQRDKQPSTNTPVYLVGGKPEAPQLRPRHHAVLTRREPRYARFDPGLVGLTAPYPR